MKTEAPSTEAADAQPDLLHSPGEWRFDGPPNNHIVWSGPDQRVCFLTSDGPSTANARLIAAAPKLLASLKCALASLEVARFDGAQDQHDAALTVLGIQRAISAATGAT